MGVKDRATNDVIAAPVTRVDSETLGSFIQERVRAGAKLYTDGNAAYPMDHEAVRHNMGEYVRGQAHTNGIESFWAMLKRGYYGTYHRMSPKHLGRYVKEFSGRHNQRFSDTLVQMRLIAVGMCGKRLRYKDLIA